LVRRATVSRTGGLRVIRRSVLLQALARLQFREKGVAKQMTVEREGVEKSNRRFLRHPQAEESAWGSVRSE
jgi:hypothetical protein